MLKIKPALRSDRVMKALTGLMAAVQDDLSKVQKAGQPIYLVHAMDKFWTKPFTWQPRVPVFENKAKEFSPVCG